MNLSILEFSQMCLTDIDHDYFTFFDLKRGKIASFSTYPQMWCDHYLTQNYDKIDYVLLKNSFVPFVWGEKISKDVTPLQKIIFKEAQDFHISKGITIPLSLTRSPGAITLAFNKGDKFQQSQILKLDSHLTFFCQMMITYKDLLEGEGETPSMAIQLVQELAIWQKDCQKQKKKHQRAVLDVLSDVRSAQMFISHHETKELGLETLERIYKDVERLI